jgi:hypothetical protein
LRIAGLASGSPVSGAGGACGAGGKVVVVVVVDVVDVEVEVVVLVVLVVLEVVVRGGDGAELVAEATVVSVVVTAVFEPDEPHAVASRPRAATPETMAVRPTGRGGRRPAVPGPVPDLALVLAIGQSPSTLLLVPIDRDGALRY